MCECVGGCIERVPFNPNPVRLDATRTVEVELQDQPLIIFKDFSRSLRGERSLPSVAEKCAKKINTHQDALSTTPRRSAQIQKPVQSTD